MALMKALLSVGKWKWKQVNMLLKSPVITSDKFS